MLGVANNGKLVGVGEDFDLANWWPSVEKHFNELAPGLRDISVPYDGKVFHGLFFSTDRAPYVVNSAPDGGQELEVPWRAGTSTRSARRSELLSVLISTTSVPASEALEARIYIRNESQMFNGTGVNADGQKTVRWLLQFSSQHFLEPTEVLSLPRHRRSIAVSVPLNEFKAVPVELHLHTKSSPGLPPVVEPAAETVNAPVIVDVRGAGSVYLPEDYVPDIDPEATATYRVELGISGSSLPLILEGSLTYSGARPGHGAEGESFEWAGFLATED